MVMSVLRYFDFGMWDQICGLSLLYHSRHHLLYLDSFEFWTNNVAKASSMILLLFKSSSCYSYHYKAITPIHNDSKRYAEVFNRQINWVMKFSADGHGAISCACKQKDFETTANRWIEHPCQQTLNEITATHSCVCPAWYHGVLFNRSNYCINVLWTKSQK